jgi:hypothetical protein
MPGPTPKSGGARRPDSESYLALLANLGGVLAAIVVLFAIVRFGERPPAPSAPPSPSPIAAPAPAEPPPTPAPAVVERPAPTAAPKAIDREAVARAQAALDAASRDRARAEARVQEAAIRLADASAQAAADAANARTIALRVRDPSAQISRASARGAFLKGERDRLKGELATLAHTPRPKAKQLVDRTPVAKPAGGDEYHFEVRRNRVSFIDLERLTALVKADAQLRIRLSDNSRMVESKVGPVGAFSLHYILGRALPQGLEEMIERHGLSYDFRGWEIVPEFEGRGETFEAARQPISNFSRVINRLNPAHATITMWVYPDGFGLYRKLRDELHGRDFMVAARPLPEGVPIRGSPAGTQSAGQ